jgi:ferric-dicitrate binding protein FerR (iron transport regulator)
MVANTKNKEKVSGTQAPSVGASKIDWTSGRLSFAGARLVDVIAAANRYTRRRIVADDPAIQELRVTGVFRTGDAEVLAGSLAAAFGLRTATDADGNIHLQRSKAKSRGGRPLDVSKPVEPRSV